MVEKSHILTSFVQHERPIVRQFRRRKRGLFLPALVVNSPLRSVDPRAKLFLSSAASLAVMMPLARMGMFMALYALLLLWARLLPAAIRQIWRLKVLLVVLFVVMS